MFLLRNLESHDLILIRLLESSTSFMISIFSCLAWQPMTTFFTYTKSHAPITKLTMWHLNPMPRTYADLDSCYRPTDLQLFTPHPRVIDWVPFPWLRDRLILFHASNPRLDDVICEIADAYACNIDPSALITGFNMGLGYVCVRDLLDTISDGADDGHEDQQHCMLDNSFGDTSFAAPDQLDFMDLNLESSCASHPSIPAPSVTALFNSKSLALQVFRLLKMDKGLGRLRLDPQFFERHQELWDDNPDSIAQGVPIRPPKKRSIPLKGPNPLDARVISKYKEMVTWNFDRGISDEVGVNCV
jgi:Domain of unknown function (DUF3425)